MIICGTGHRPDKLGGYSQETFDKLVALAEVWLITTGVELGVTEVISGLALGWDQALADAVIRINYRALGKSDKRPLKLVGAVPFKGQERKWPQKSQDYYDIIVKHCDEVVEVCEPGYAAWKMQARNEYMVNQSDLVLALWNGTPGGTANCVRYAQQQGKKIINLWREWESG